MHRSINTIVAYAIFSNIAFRQSLLQHVRLNSVGLGRTSAIPKGGLLEGDASLILLGSDLPLTLTFSTGCKLSWGEALVTSPLDANAYPMVFARNLPFLSLPEIAY
jgi:hypothetical protein